MLLFQYIINTKLLIRHFPFFVFVFETQYAFFTYSTSQSRPAMFQAFNRCVWPVTTMLDSTVLDYHKKHTDGKFWKLPILSLTP